MSFTEAYETVLAHCRRILADRPMQVEEVALLQALDRVLAEPVLADRDFPPFPRATRDGYAVRSTDLDTAMPVLLRVVGQIKAGDSYDLPLASGEAVEIMTGAAVPPGADAVVMVEYTERKADHRGHEGAQSLEILELGGGKSSSTNLDADDLVEIQRPVTAGENVVPAGAEARAGQELLPRGARLGTAQIALAAASGNATLKVFRKPRVAILSTGDELVEVAGQPGPSQIRNSNSYSLATAVAACGGDPVRLPIAPDEPGKLTELVRQGLKTELLLLSGGVSMGKFDLVESVLKELGAEFFFTGVLIQPGKPVVFGEALSPAHTPDTKKGQANTAPGRTPFFGLPGNPVSVMVTFDLFAWQIVEALSGATPARLCSAQVRLKKEFKTRTGLTRFLPAIVAGGLYDSTVEIVPWQGSGDLLAAARANCYLVVPPDREKLEAGEMVTVVLR